MIASRGKGAHYVHTFPAWLYSLLRAYTEKNMNTSKKKERVVFYFEKIDKDLLFNHCNLIGVKTSFFVRNTILEELGKPVIKIQVENVNTKKYVSELIRIGVNLNQVARKLNSGATFLIADQRKVLDEMEALTSHILEIKSQL